MCSCFRQIKFRKMSVKTVKLSEDYTEPPKYKWQHLMIDVESLGNKPGAVITEISAVPFNWDNKNSTAEDIFYVKINIDSSLKAGLQIQADTLQWWAQQDITVFRNMMDQKDAINLSEALYKFRVYLQTLYPSQLKVWGNSNRFDFGLLAAAYDAIRQEIPWYFRNERDVRTLVDLYPEIKENHIFYGKAHIPEFDNLNQIDYCVETKNRLRRIV